MKCTKVYRGLAALFAGVFFCGVAVAAQGPVVVRANGACNSTLYEFVDTPVAVQYNAHGEFRVPLTPSGILRVGNCRHLYFEIDQGQGTGYQIDVGKITGATLSETALAGNDRDIIQSLELKGPDVDLWLKGTPNTSESVQLWLYLTN